MHASAFPDLHVEVLDLIAGDDRVVVRARMTGTHEGSFVGIPASGRTVEHEFADVARFNDHGQLVEIWNYADSLALAQQLQPGQVSAP
jgi:predicted ester cyclase